MVKRVFIIHGWDGYPQEGWFPWLKKELEKKGFDVEVPKMPDPAKPKIDDWVSYLSKTVGSIDVDSFFVGHSVGCQTILRYLETLPNRMLVGGCVFVAPWFNLVGLTEDEERVIRPWLEKPMDFTRIKLHTRSFTSIFSDNDPFVSLDNKELFKTLLGSKIIVKHKKGHFSGGDNITKMPDVFKTILKMSQ